MRFLLLPLVLVAASCHYKLRVDPLDLEAEALRLGEADFAEVLHALEHIELAGEASLKAGTFALSSANYEAMEVREGTQLRFEAAVEIASVEARRGDEHLRIVPNVERFDLAFSQPVVLHGRNSATRAALDGARLREGQELEVGVRVGKSLVGSLAAAVAGVPAGGNLPDALEMVERVEVPELVASLRRGSVLLHGRSELHLRQRSQITLRDIDLHPAAGTARAELSGELLFGRGTCLELMDARLCSDEMTMRVRGDYQRSSEGTERFRLTQLNAPSVLEVAAGTVHLEAGDVELQQARLQLDRYECAGSFGAENLSCAYEIAGEVTTGAGQTTLEGMPLHFNGVQLEGLRFATADDGDASVKVARLTVQHPRLELPASSAAKAEATMTSLRLEGLQGSKVGMLAFGAADVIAEEGRVQVALGDVVLSANLTGETRIHLSQRELLSFGETDEPVAPSLAIRTEVEQMELRHADALLVQARGVEIDANISETETTAEIRLSEALRVDPSALAEVEVADARFADAGTTYSQERGSAATQHGWPAAFDTPGPVA